MILQQIQNEIDDFENKDITIVPGFSFNQKATIERIYRYYHSRYETGDIDADGDKKYFFNINKHPCDVMTKAIDFDTKDIQVQTASGGSPLKTWFFERDLKFWFKDKKFGKVLNRIFWELPIFGSVVVKVIEGTPYFVDLRNFVVEQSSDVLKKANYLIERHNFTVPEFRKVGRELGWDNLEEAIEKFRETNTRYLVVYERYGEVEEDNYKYERVYVADVGKDEIDERTGETKPRSGVILSKKEITIDDLPYWEFHLRKIPGRWLGVGNVEILFDPQVRINENDNLEAKGSYWASLHLFQTRSDDFNRNLKTEVRDGEVLSAEEPLTQVEIAERNLAFFNNVAERWISNRDELTFSYDVVSGERLPAGTPLGAARIAAVMAGNYFDQIREDVALEVKDFLFEMIIPQFEKEISSEHVLRLAGDDLDKINNLIIEEKTTEAVFDFVKKNKRLPSLIQQKALKAAVSQRVKKGKEKLVVVPKGYYQGLKYKIDIIITGEQKNAVVRAQSLFAALQAITADPTLLTDPIKRKVFSQWLEQGGLNIFDLQGEVEEPTPDKIIPPRVGGGVSRPAVIAPVSAPPAEKTL